jgi:hypothetical protein
MTRRTTPDNARHESLEDFFMLRISVLIAALALMETTAIGISSPRRGMFLRYLRFKLS